MGVENTPSPEPLGLKVNKSKKKRRDGPGVFRVRLNNGRPKQEVFNKIFLTIYK